jgi:glycerol-1-phosphate dehydrogenase [NAD(P)+]
MNDSRIQKALQSATDTRIIEIGEGVIDSVAEVFRKCFPGKSAIVIADDNTYSVAGHTVQNALSRTGIPSREPFVFPGAPRVYADYDTVLTVVAELQKHDAVPIAVGSGSINDIAKLASRITDRRYMVVGTAASMDGYSAFGASISRDGYKQTFSCPAPVAVIGDVRIISGAPSAMAASGYADLLGKITAGGDWIIADAVGVEKIDPLAWSLVQDSLRDWTAHPKLLASKDVGSTEKLMEGLILTGLAMQAHKSSRPGSGSEHQFSHLWEMQHLEKEGLWLSHGFKVGVGSIAMAAMYERLFLKRLDQINPEKLLQERLGPQDMEQKIRAQHSLQILRDKGVEESLAKYANQDTLMSRLKTVQTLWPDLRTRLKTQLMTAQNIQQLLRDAGCPVTPNEIGLDEEAMKRSYAGAQQIRRRYTMLDLAVETGVFEHCVEEMFIPGGFWTGAPT